MNLIGLDLTYAPKDKEQKATPETAPSPAPQSTNDLSFLLMVIAVIFMAGAVAMMSGALLAQSARA